MRINNSWLRQVVLASCTLGACAGIGFAQPAPSISPTYRAQQQVMAYLARLADLHCTESLSQEKLTPDGHVEATERAQYDYLVMIQGNNDGLQLNESRLLTSSSNPKPLPMLVTNGFSTLLLVFHPYYIDSFDFHVGEQDMVSGRRTLPIHFEHLAGHRSPAALALRGREFPLDLAGTAWLDIETGQVVKMQAALMHDMSDIGLRSLKVDVDYKAFDLGKPAGIMTLPAQAVVEVTTPRQHWRNSHSFSNYKSFSTEAEQDQNAVKVHKDKTTDQDSNATEQTTPESASPENKSPVNKEKQ